MREGITVCVLLSMAASVAFSPIDALSAQGGLSFSHTPFVQPGPCSPSWRPTFGELPGTNGSVYSLATYDDGSGPALFVGGSLTTAGGIDASRIAKWDGTRWSAVGGGVSGGALGPLHEWVKALAVYDDGGGPALYVGGTFTSAGGVAAKGIARWN